MRRDYKLPKLFLCILCFSLIISFTYSENGKPKNQDSTNNSIFLKSKNDTILPPSLRTFNFKNSDIAKIVGVAYGEYVASNGEFPHQVAFWCKDKYICGGTIIHPNWIMTAGHCFDSCQSNSYGITAGTIDLKSTVGAQDIPGKRYIRHPQYNAAGWVYDIALIELTKPLTLKENVKTAYLETQEYAEGTKTWVTGWGTTETGSTSVLKKVQVPIVNVLSCAGDVRDPKIMICAGDGVSGKDACAGDSGGPLGLFRGSDFFVGGIVSSGPANCGDRSNRGLYTKVSNFVDFVARYVPLNVTSDGGSSAKRPTNFTFLIVAVLLVSLILCSQLYLLCLL